MAWREEWHRDFEPDRVAVGLECFLATDLTTEAYGAHAVISSYTIRHRANTPYVARLAGALPRPDPRRDSPGHVIAPAAPPAWRGVLV